MPIYEIERKYGISASSIKYFCCLYKIHGEKENYLDNSPTKNFFGRMKEEIFYSKEHLYKDIQ